MELVPDDIKQLEYEDRKHIPFRDKTPFSIRLYNTGFVRADITIWMDGEQVGKYRVEARSEILVERPVNANRKFISIPEDSEAAMQAGIVKGYKYNGKLGDLLSGI